MGYASIMVAVDPEGETRARVTVAAHLADTFGAELVGVAAERPDYGVFSADPATGGPFVLPVLHDLCRERLGRAGALFAGVAGRRRTAWHADIADPLSFLLTQAVAADVVVMGHPLRDSPASRFAIDPADAVMELGRPLLLVPDGIEHLAASRVAIGWKNTREARRVVADAMPFLRRAAKVVVCTVGDGSGSDGAHDLVRYLDARGIPAVAAHAAGAGAGTAEALIDTACEHAADLLVTGAYGHSRLREWAFGGVTRDLLRRSPICCLMSH